jgi:hypothetical protein
MRCCYVLVHVYVLDLCIHIIITCIDNTFMYVCLFELVFDICMMWYYVVCT